MNGRNASVFSSTISRLANGGRRGAHRSNNAALLFAAGIIACFWPVRPCKGQIEAEAYISNTESNNVSVIDTSSGTVVSTISVAPEEGPAGVAVTPDGRFAYITNGAIPPAISDTVSVLDVATNTVVQTITLGTPAAGIAVTPNANFAYAADLNGTVPVINTSTNSVSDTVPLGTGTVPQGVAITPDGRFAYVVDKGTNAVSVINTANNTLVGTPIPLGPGTVPVGVAITPDGGFVYVTNSATNTVSVIATATNTVVRTIDLTPSIGVNGQPVGVAVAPDGNFVYVTSAPTNTVSVIATATDTVSQTIQLPVGTDPGGVSLTPNGAFAFVAGFSSDTVFEIDTATNAVVRIIAVGTGPLAFGSFIGPNIIVAQGGPLLISSDAALTPLGFGTFVDFNGGTLETTGSLITSRTISLLRLGGTIDTNGFDSIFSGNIINSGSLTKIGTGTLTLSGINSYTGGTNIFGGVLSVNSDANLGTGNINFGNNAELLTTGTNFSSNKAIALGNGGGTLASANGATAVYGGVISGIGPLNIGDGINLGTIVLNAANTYSGGTKINGTILQIGADVNLGAASGALIFNGGTLQTLASFSSGRAATLNATGGTFETDAGTTFTEGGTITGGGGLTKTGTGMLILGGNNTYSGGTILNSGTLVVNSAQALGLGNVVVNGGVLRADPQPINVQGNYTQNAGGTLQLRLGGIAPGQFDFLNVGGRAALDGTLQLLALNSFQPRIGDKFTLVLAAGGVSGQFANVLDPFSTSLIALELVYLQNSVLLEFASNFAAFAQTPNQLAVARQLDSVPFDPREAQLISFLENEPLGNLGADFEKISPDSLSAIYEISFSAANVQAANLENRFAEIRNGSTGFTSSLNISNSPNTMAESNGKAVIEPSKNVLTPTPENKWGVWISGSGEFVNVSGDGNGKGYDFTTGGVSFGLDYRLTKNLTVGVAAGYAHTWTNLTGNGNIDVDSGRGGLYATFFEGGFYLNGYAGGVYNSYQTMRDALGGGASGSGSGGEFDGYAGGGYELHCGGFTFGPIASLEYIYVGVSGYNESGSLAPLRIVSQNQDSLRTNLGLSASYICKAGKVQLRPSLRASWQHEYFYSALPIDAQFASGAGSVFTVHGPAEGHDSALIDAGIDVQWTPTIGTYFGYNGQVGRSNYDSHSLICSVHLAF